jgi:hypothetical protein
MEGPNASLEKGTGLVAWRYGDSEEEDYCVNFGYSNNAKNTISRRRQYVTLCQTHVS